MDGLALSLFCFASAEGLSKTAGPDWGDDGNIRPLEVDNVTAWVSDVPRDDFEGPGAEERLQDLSWVGPRALRHGEVISKIMCGSPVFPARFGTLFSSEDALLDFMKRNHEAIASFLDRVRDSEEWAVKGIFSRTEAKERLFRDLMEEHSEDLAAKPLGLRYFKEQQLRTRVEKEIGAWLKEVCSKVADELNACSHDSVKRPVGALSSVGSEGSETVVNWAFLVGSDCLEEFLTAIERANNEFRDHGLIFHASGPWPPYSFCPSLVSEAGQ